MEAVEEPCAMDVLPLLIAHTALTLHPPATDVGDATTTLSSPPRSVVVFDALALLAHLASASTALHAAVHARVPQLAAAGAAARAKRDALRAVRAALSAPEHGVVGVFAPLSAELGGSLQARYAAVLDDAMAHVTGCMLRASLCALERADAPPEVLIASGHFVDEIFRTTLDHFGLQVCGTEDWMRALRLVMQRRGGGAFAASDDDDDGDDAVLGLAADAAGEEASAIPVGQSVMYDIMCAVADAGVISEEKFARLMTLYDRTARAVCAIDDPVVAACLPQLAEDAAGAWRAFGAYVARCLACPLLARARGQRLSADAMAAAAEATVRELQSMTLLPAESGPMQVPDGALGAAHSFATVLMRTVMYQKDLNAILRGRFPCKPRNEDVISLSYFEMEERMAALVMAQQDGA
jgi:hypothetical protein